MWWNAAREESRRRGQQLDLEDSSDDLEFATPATQLDERRDAEKQSSRRVADLHVDENAEAGLAGTALPSPYPGIGIVHSMKEEDNTQSTHIASRERQNYSTIEHPNSPSAKQHLMVTFYDIRSPEKEEGEMSSPAAAVSDKYKASEHKKKPLNSAQRRVEDEGLGDDWALTPWKEPRYGYILCI